MEQSSKHTQTVENFTAAYQNLEGITYGEKRKNLFKLLNSFKTLDELVKLQIITFLKEDSHLEKLFKIETLIFFKLPVELFDILATEVSDVTHKILKQQWLFQEPFHKISAFSIVKEFLPRFSLVNRHRILFALSKYHKNENKIDEVFDALLCNYGLDTAKLVLSGCSVNKIDFAVKILGVQLKQRQLLSVFDKSPSLFLYIVTESSYFDRGRGKKLCKYLLQIDLEICLAVARNNYFNLGKRCTRKLLPIYKSKIIMSPKDYFSYLHKKTLKKCFSKADLCLALKNLFPKKFTDFRSQYTVSDVLYLFPCNEQYQLYSETYKEVYNVSLWDNVCHMHEDMVEDVADIKEREKWIEYKIKEGVSDTRYIHCYPPAKSIEMIKTKLNFISTYRTTEVLMEKLLDTCKFHYNENPVELKNVLLDILKYICKRHRNNDSITTFASHLMYSFNVSDLTQEHWKYINEILEVIKVKNIYFSSRSSFISKYIEFMWKNNLPIEEYVSKYVTDNFHDYVYHFKEMDRSLQKFLIKSFLEMNLMKIVANEPKQIEQDKTLLMWIIEWNRYNNNDCIDISNYPRLLASFNNILDDGNRSAEMMFKDALCTKGMTNLRDHLMRIYFNKYLNKFRATSIYIIIWFQKNDPSSLAQYVDLVVKFIYSRPTDKKKYHYKYQELRKNDLVTVISYILKLPDYTFQGKLISFGLENYTNSDNKENLDLNCSLKIMAHLMNPQNYVDFVKKHLTFSDKMEIDDENKYNDLLIGKAMMKSLIYCRSTLILPLLIQSDFPDYFNDTLNTLHFYFHHISENFLREYSAKLQEECSFGRNVAFSLTCIFGSVEDVTNIYRTTLNDVDDTSQRKLFRKALRYLGKNSSDELFNVISNQFKDLTKSDRRVLKIVKKMQCTPLSCRVKLLHFVLANSDCSNEQSLLPDIAEVLMNGIGNDINKTPSEYRVKLLACIIRHQESNCFLKQTISKLLEEIDNTFFVGISNEVCVSFIDYFLFKEQAVITTDIIYKFTIHYLLHSESDFSLNCDIIFNKIIELQSQEFPDFSTKLKTKRRITQFISIISMHMKHLRLDMIQTFHDKLLSLFPTAEILDLICYIRALLIKTESNSVRIMSEKFYNLVEEICSNYGGHLIKLIANCVKNVFRDDDDCDQMLYSICYTLYEVDCSSFNCLFILLLLPVSEPVDKNERQKFFRFLSSLNKHVDPVVKIQLGLFVNSY